jgi:hypothetical protein
MDCVRKVLKPLWSPIVDSKPLADDVIQQGQRVGSWVGWDGTGRLRLFDVAIGLIVVIVPPGPGGT